MTAEGSKLSRVDLRARLSGLSVEALLWTMSLFCGTMGAFLLVAPHRFQSPPYRALLPYGVEWGILALGSGLGLLAVAVLRPPRWVTLCVHGLAGLTLLTLAISFGRIGGLTGVIIYTLLALGTVFAGLLPRGRPVDGGDLFGLGQACNGGSAARPQADVLEYATFVAVNEV